MAINLQYKQQTLLKLHLPKYSVGICRPTCLATFSLSVLSFLSTPTLFSVKMWVSSLAALLIVMQSSKTLATRLQSASGAVDIQASPSLQNSSKTGASCLPSTSCGSRATSSKMNYWYASLWSILLGLSVFLAVQIDSFIVNQRTTVLLMKCSRSVCEKSYFI